MANTARIPGSVTVPAPQPVPAPTGPLGPLPDHPGATTDRLVSPPRPGRHPPRCHLWPRRRRYRPGPRDRGDRDPPGPGRPDGRRRPARQDPRPTRGRPAGGGHLVDQSGRPAPAGLATVPRPDSPTSASSSLAPTAGSPSPCGCPDRSRRAWSSGRSRPPGPGRVPRPSRPPRPSSATVSPPAALSPWPCLSTTRCAPRTKSTRSGPSSARWPGSARPSRRACRSWPGRHRPPPHPAPQGGRGPPGREARHWPGPLRRAGHPRGQGSRPRRPTRLSGGGCGGHLGQGPPSRAGPIAVRYAVATTATDRRPWAGLRGRAQCRCLRRSRCSPGATASIATGLRHPAQVLAARRVGRGDLVSVAELGRPGPSAHRPGRARPGPGWGQRRRPTPRRLPTRWRRSDRLGTTDRQAQLLGHAQAGGRPPVAWRYPHAPTTSTSWEPPGRASRRCSPTWSSRRRSWPGRGGPRPQGRPDYRPVRPAPRDRGVPGRWLIDPEDPDAARS